MSGEELQLFLCAGRAEALGFLCGTAAVVDRVKASSQKDKGHTAAPKDLEENCHLHCEPVQDQIEVRAGESARPDVRLPLCCMAMQPRTEDFWTTDKVFLDCRQIV